MEEQKRMKRGLTVPVRVSLKAFPESAGATLVPVSLSLIEVRPEVVFLRLFDLTRMTD